MTMTHQSDICLTRKAHVWETLEDGSRMCFECDTRQSAPHSIVCDTPPPDICRNRHGGNAESEDAFKDLLPTLSRTRHRVFRLIHGSGGGGLTVHEAAATLGKTPNAVSGRFTELKAAGYISQHGRRPTPTGSSAGVYRVTLAGAMLVDGFLNERCSVSGE